MELYQRQGSDQGRYGECAGLQPAQSWRTIYAQWRVEQADFSFVCRERIEQALLEGYRRELRRYLPSFGCACDGAPVRAIQFLRIGKACSAESKRKTKWESHGDEASRN